MKIYIAGKITGLPLQITVVKFASAERKIRMAGHEPVNPIGICPFDPAKTWADYMAEGFRSLLDCEGIFLLRDWADSKGAKIEKAVAESMGLAIFTETEGHFGQEKRAC